MKNDKKQKCSNSERERILKTSPFNTINSDYKYIACVGTNGGYNQSTIYEGFKDAVNTMIESIGEYKNFADPLVYPILFCIRHSIELFLKDLYNSIQYIKGIKENRDIFIKLNKARIIQDKLSKRYDDYEWIIKNKDEGDSSINAERNKKRQAILKNRIRKITNYIDLCSKECFKDLKKEDFTHNLNELIQKITTIYNIDIRIKESFDKVLPLLRFYKDIDPNGDAFRYWSDKEGNPHFEKKEIGIVNIHTISVQFEEITNLFSNIDWLMWYLRKEYNTGTFTKDLSREQLEEISKLLPQPNEFSEKIKQVKNQIKKKYDIGSNKFDYALKIIRGHREFSSYMGEEKLFSCLSEETIKIFAECSLNKRNWKEASSKIIGDELSLLVTFSDISGWRYPERKYAYFSEDLQFLYSEKRKKYGDKWCDINPITEIDYVIEGMQKCGQITYAKTMEEHILKLKNNS